MTNLLRCSKCGIADENVKSYPLISGAPDCHDSDWDCALAALALLNKCRPYVQSGADVYARTRYRKEARALLAQMPEAK